MECAGEVKIFVHFLAIPSQKLQCEITTFWFEKPEAMTANFWYFQKVMLQKSLNISRNAYKSHDVVQRAISLFLLYGLNYCILLLCQSTKAKVIPALWFTVCQQNTAKYQ